MTNKQVEKLMDQVPQTTGLAPNNVDGEPVEDTKYVLVLGPRGAGKSTFVNTAYGGSPARRRPVAQDSELCTKQFWSAPKFSTFSQHFAFIDSPGFDNKAMCDEAIFVGIMDHLSKNSEKPMKLTGIIYVHPEGDDLGSRTLWRNLGMLGALIGRAYLDRVTIIIKTRSQNNSSMDERALASTFSRPQTPFSYFYHGVRHRIWAFRQWTWGTMQKALSPYKSMPPIYFYAQVETMEGRWESGRLIPQLQALLRSPFAKNCLCDQQPQEETSSLTTNGQQETEGLVAATGSLPEDESNIHARLKSKGQDSSGQDEPEDNPVHQEDIKRLKEQLKKAQNDYASICEHLQVQDNVEEARVAKSLDDINRLITKIGLSVSRQIHEIRSESNLLESLGDARQLGELERMFGHIEGKSSLVLSSSGKYIDPGDFFDYAIRATLCQKLDEMLFKPFHPSTTESDNSITDIYNQIRCHESQLMAGRWRRDAFNAMDRLSAMNPAKIQSPKLHEILADSLDDLLKCCSTPRFEARITETDKKDLVKLADMAEDWNTLVKGSVVYLGDFHPMVVSYGKDFEPCSMSELQIDPRIKQIDHPETILATTALGLKKIYALGGGQNPDETVVCKAMIVSERICTFV